MEKIYKNRTWKTYNASSNEKKAKLCCIDKWVCSFHQEYNRTQIVSSKILNHMSENKTQEHVVRTFSKKQLSLYRIWDITSIILSFWEIIGK